jgi:hypothetical protein
MSYILQVFTERKISKIELAPPPVFLNTYNAMET